MNNEAKLPKTQAATLAEIRRIETTDEPAVKIGVARKGINTQAVRALRDKGYLRTIHIEGVGHFVVSA